MQGLISEFLKFFIWLFSVFHSEPEVANWWTLQDSNLRPTGYEPAALTNCAKGPEVRLDL